MQIKRTNKQNKKKPKVLKIGSGPEERPTVSSFCLTQNITSVLKLQAKKKTRIFTHDFLQYKFHIYSLVLLCIYFHASTQG